MHRTDENFVAKAAPILQLYAQASFLIQGGFWVVCVYGCCRDSKKFVDFQTFVLEVLIPEAIRRGVRHINLILDNGSTHAAFAVAGVVKPKAG